MGKNDKLFELVSRNELEESVKNGFDQEKFQDCLSSAFNLIKHHVMNSNKINFDLVFRACVAQTVKILEDNYKRKFFKKQFRLEDYAMLKKMVMGYCNSEKCDSSKFCRLSDIEFGLDGDIPKIIPHVYANFVESNKVAHEFFIEYIKDVEMNERGEEGWEEWREAVRSKYE